VAIRLTRWLRERGVPPAHVTVHFEEQPPNSVFSGGLPVEALGGSGSDLPYASVVCRISPDRPETFRRELAAELADALGAGPGTGYLSIEFRPTRPDHVYVWRSDALVRADRLADPERMLSQ
jgi:hypothetical protein